MLLARGTCSHKLVIRVDLLYIVQIVIVEPELGDCEDIGGMIT